MTIRPTLVLVLLAASCAQDPTPGTFVDTAPTPLPCAIDATPTSVEKSSCAPEGRAQTASRQDPDGRSHSIAGHERAVASPLLPVLADPWADTDGPFQRCAVFGVGKVQHQRIALNGDVIIGTAAGLVARISTTGERLWRSFVQRNPIRLMATSPDDRLIAVADERTVRVLSAESGALAQEWEVSRLPIAMAFDPAGKRLALGYLVDQGKPGVEVIEVATGITVMSATTSQMTIAVKWNPNGSTIGLVAKKNGHPLGQPTPSWVQVRSAADGNLIRQIAGESFAWSESGSAIVVGRENGEVARLDIQSGDTKIRTLFSPAEAKGSSPRKVAQIKNISATQTLLVAKDDTHHILVVSSKTLEVEHSLATWQLGELDVAPNGDSISFIRNGDLFMRPLLEETETQVSASFGPTAGLADDGTITAITSDNMSWRLSAESSEWPLAAVAKNYGRTAISTDGSTIAIDDGSAIRVMTGDGEALGILEGSVGRASAMAVSPDGTWIAAATGPSSIRMWRSSNLSVHDDYPSDPINQNSAIFDRVRDLVFSPDGRFLAAAGGGFYQTRIWELESGQESKLSPKAASLAFHASSDVLYAVPHSQKGVKRYDITEPMTNEVPIEIAGYSRMSVWTPAGLLVSSKSKTVLYDEVTGDELAAFPGAGEIRATSDGALIVLATSAGTIDVFCHAGSSPPKGSP